jgi:hypothetical protein
LLIELLVEGVVEAAAWSPQEPDAEFPGRLSQCVEAFATDPEEIEDVFGEVWRRAFSNADDSDRWTAHHANRKLRELPFQRDGCNQAGTAGA